MCLCYCSVGTAMAASGAARCCRCVQPAGQQGAAAMFQGPQCSSVAGHTCMCRRALPAAYLQATVQTSLLILWVWRVGLLADLPSCSADRRVGRGVCLHPTGQPVSLCSCCDRQVCLVASMLACVACCKRMVPAPWYPPATLIIPIPTEHHACALPQLLPCTVCGRCGCLFWVGGRLSRCISLFRR
jgi:hypothetical protein